MHSGVCVTVRCPSVCLSVCLSQYGHAVANPLLQVSFGGTRGSFGEDALYESTSCITFAAVGSAGGRYRSIAARQQRRAAGEYGQCHVVSVRRKLNADLFIIVIVVELKIHLTLSEEKRMTAKRDLNQRVGRRGDGICHCGIYQS